MYYVYIIQSRSVPNKFYIGYTGNIKKRLTGHNTATTHHTAKYKPWKLIMFLAFDNKMLAIEFEKYLKTPSGKAFAFKRLYHQ